jgi:hypothetical protein
MRPRASARQSNEEAGGEKIDREEKSEAQANVTPESRNHP